MATQSIADEMPHKTAEVETPLRTAVVNTVMRLLELDGLQKAKKVFSLQNEMFSHLPDWPMIADEVYNIFAKEHARIKEEEEKKAKRLEDAWLEGMRKGAIQSNLLTGGNASAGYYPNPFGDDSKH